MRPVLIVTFLAATVPLMAAPDGKTPAPAAHAPQSAAAPALDAAAAAPAAPYRYGGQGRRDPFVSLIGTGGDSHVAAKPTGEGLAGLRVEEIAVRGVVKTQARPVAMVQGPDSRSYVVHQGDKLADGIVKSVAADGLVLVQDVNDPRAKEKTREVRKLLRNPEGKE